MTEDKKANLAVLGLACVMIGAGAGMFFSEQLGLPEWSPLAFLVLVIAALLTHAAWVTKKLGYYKDWME